VTAASARPPLPRTWPRQPDGFTCGPSAVVVARDLADGPVTGWPDFAARVHATSRRLHRWWPRLLGTTPWAVARALGGRVRPYRDDTVRAALPHPVPVFVGSRVLPRHVVLVLDTTADDLLAYDPARGDLVPLSTLRWPVRWCAVLPPSRHEWYA
jgi:hypothetical protein